MMTSVAFRELIDYAGLFPPAQLSMAPAIDAYDALRNCHERGILGRFIVPVSRMDAYLEALGDRRFPLSLILDAGPTEASLDRSFAWIALNRDDLGIESIEVPGASIPTIAMLAAARDRHLPPTLRIFCELALDDELEMTFDALHQHGLLAKVRCGGVVASAYPSAASLSRFILAAATASVPYKATAGLHHPIRGVLDESNGAIMHGFLNVLVATALARHAPTPDALSAVLLDGNPSAFELDESGLRYRGTHIPEHELAEVRLAGFTSFGSCSFLEPIADLRDIGMLEPQ